MKHRITAKNEYYHSRVCLLIWPEDDAPYRIVGVKIGNDIAVVSYPGEGVSAHAESISEGFNKPEFPLQPMR